VLVEPTTCKSGAPTQDGSKFSSMRRTNLSTGRAAKFLKSRLQRMMKEHQLAFTVTTEEETNNGQSSILTKLTKIEPRVLIQNSDSTLIDHSISDLDFHSKELLNATELTMSGSRDGETMLDNNSGTSMKSPRLSRITTGSLTHLTSNPTVDQATSDALLPTQDGGRCSDMTIQLQPLITREERSLKLLEESMLRTEILVSIPRTTRSTNNGISSMLTNGRVNQLRDNSMRDLDSMLKETSM